MSESVQVPYETVVSHLRARIADDAVTIAVLRARVDALEGGDGVVTAGDQPT